MKLLILGGTKFLGRHLVEQALPRGHEITLFHRGLGGCSLYPEVEHVHGDRESDLGQLAGRRWDAVVDTSGYVPRVVGESARFLADAADHYTFISSISVYRECPPGTDENGAVHELSDPAVEEITEETYGGLKFLCEQAAEAAMPGRILNVRAGLIVGSYDPTDRFTYWVRRVAAGGDVLVPEPPDRPLQVIHAADLAGWVLDMAESGRGGVFNVTGPPDPFTMETLVETIKEAAGGTARWVWAPESILTEHKAAFWSELPLCLPATEPFALAADVTRATEAGLVCRPLLQTVRETLVWDMSRPAGTQLNAGLTPEREVGLLGHVRAAS